MTQPPAPPWWQTGVVYQVYPRSFQDSDGDGVGDLLGITARLGYLANLGVDAVWISPFYPSPGADGGYDVADYCDIDPQLGTLADFDRLVAEAHRLGLRVVVDWVPNHSSDQHPWFRESREARDTATRDWYVWRDARAGPNGGATPQPPNNWLSAFGGSAWTWDPTTAQFYLHSFLPEQPDLNWRNTGLRAAMLDTLRFWLDRGVDGFRVDVAHHLSKDPLLRDNPPEPTPDAGHKPVSDYDRQRHLHDRAHPDVHGLFRTFRRVVDEHDVGRVRALFGEIHLAHDLEQWATYFGDGDELHLPLHFGLLSVPWTAEGLRTHVEAVEAALPPGAWPSWVLGSHDEHRLATRLGPDLTRLAAMLLLTLRGTPTLYAGDEIGTPQVEVPPSRLRDPAGVRTGVPALGRDGGRTPMAWDGSAGAGFSSADASSLWLPLHPTHGTVHVARQWDAAGSLLALYRQLLALRRATPALHRGSFQALDADTLETDNVFGYERRHNDSQVRVLLNVGRVPTRVPLPLGPWRVVASTHLRENIVASIVDLDAFEGVMLSSTATKSPMPMS